MNNEKTSEKNINSIAHQFKLMAATALVATTLPYAQKFTQEILEPDTVTVIKKNSDTTQKLR